ncbi:hypothetical protein ACVWYG_001208 [Pedobacter sp. UYEF25]
MYRDNKSINGTSILKSALLVVLCCAVAMALPSCNKDFEGVLHKDYNNDSLAVSAGKKKVLYIILDGVRGSVLSTMKPDNIVKINKNATYSFNALNDSTSITPTNAGSWTDMITGVPVTAHKVLSNDFAGNKIAEFPSIFTRLKQVSPYLKTVSFAASASFDSKLAIDASEHTVFSADAEVQTALKGKIGSNDADLIVAEFNSADVAGNNGGYNVANTSYTAAITVLDGYLGEAIAAIKMRPSYADESWLVVIASNKGGVDPTAPTGDATLFGDPSKNTYVALYNPAFDTKAYGKPNTTEIAYTGKSPRFQSTGSASVQGALSNTDVGNFGASGDYTLMFKFRNDYDQASYYPMFFAKRDAFNSVSSTGWGFLNGGNSSQLDWSGTPRQGFGIDIRDAQWHTAAFTISVIGGQRTLTLYVDAVKRVSNSISRNPDNAIPLRIGADAGGGSDQANFLLTDLAIFNVAIPETDVVTYMKREINKSNPYFDNLLGWWPCNEGTGFVLKDRSGKGNDFTLTANATWASFNDLSPNINPSISGVAYRTVPNGVDLPFTIYNWFSVLPPTSWGLSGRSFSPNYLSLSTN